MYRLSHAKGYKTDKSCCNPSYDIENQIIEIIETGLTATKMR